MKTLLFSLLLLPGCRSMPLRFSLAYENPDGHRVEVGVETGKRIVKPQK